MTIIGRFWVTAEAKFTEEKILGALKQMEAGRPVKAEELARELGVTDQRRWKRRSN